MQGILSLLDTEYTQRVAGLYTELEQYFGLRGIKEFAHPHISYQILEGYSLATVVERLQDAVNRLKPFKIHTSGLGIFLNPSPVLFIQVVRGTTVERIHRLLWKTFPPLAGSGGYYSAEEWVPHITIAQGDLTPEALPEVIAFLSRRDFHWEITLDNLTFAGETEQGFTIQHSSRFGG